MGVNGWAAEDPTRMSLEQLMDIPVVVASKYAQSPRDVAAAVSVINREDILAFGWSTLGQALASLPGFHITDDRQYTYLGTRGLSLPGDYNTRLLITLNGVRLNEPTYDSVMAGHEFPLDLDLVERIEVIPGPGGAVHGQNALFGVVNVITRSGAAIDGVELASAMQWPQRTRRVRASVGRVLDNGADFVLSASSMRSRGQDRFYDYGVAGSGVAADLDGEWDEDLYLRLAQGAWSFELAQGDRRKDDPTAAGLVDPFAADTFIRDRYLQTQLQYEDRWAGGTQQLLARLSFGSYRFSSGAAYEGERYWFTGASRSQGLDLRWLNTANHAHKLMLGLDLQRHPSQDQSAQYLPDPSYDLFYLTKGWRTGVYAQDEWTLSEALTATLGLRADRNNVNGTQLSPRAALIWKDGADATYKMLYGRAHRSPNAYERDWAIDSGPYPTLQPAIRAERIDTLELVADRRFAHGMSLRASLYHWSLRDLIVFHSADWRFVSGSPVRAKGMELSAARGWASGARLRTSLSLQDARSNASGRLVNAPRWMAKAHAVLPLASGWRAGLEVLSEGSRLAEDGRERRGPVLVNLHLSSTRLGPGVSVTFGVRNLLNQRYRQPVGIDNWAPDVEQDGRSLSVKLEARF